MTLPLVDRDPTALGPDRAPSPLTSEATVADAWRHLVATGDPAIVVMRHDRPVAVATRLAVATAMAGGHADEGVATVADFVAVPVDRDADSLATLQDFTRAAWMWLIQRHG